MTMSGTRCLAKEYKKQSKYNVFKVLVQAFACNQLFYLVYVLSFAIIASCGIDFHNVVVHSVEKKFSLISNLLLDAVVVCH